MTVPDRKGRVDQRGGKVTMPSAALGTEVQGTLDDGTPIVFRPIRRSDKDMLRRGFEMLSPESRYMRFFRAIDHLSERQLEYLTEVDFVDHVAWLAVIPSDDGAEFGVGVGRWIRDAHDRSVAEGAITVIDDYQSRGIGKALLWIMCRTAIERDVKAFRMNTLADNEAVIRLLKEYGARPGRWESGVLEVLVPLPESIEELESTPAPPILRAAAGGRIQGVAQAVGELKRFVFRAGAHDEG